MTAINVFLDNQSCHLFADTGHYHQGTKRLNHLGPKVFPLHEQQAIFAWSGPSSLGPRLAELFRTSGASNFETLKMLAPSIVAGFKFLFPFSAIIVGMCNGTPAGITIEETGRINILQPGSLVRSIPVDEALDPADVKASGVRLMEAQRQSSGVVFGEIQYWRVDRASAQMEVLHDWHDKPAPIAVPDTLAAKIAELTVEKINVTPNAVTKLVPGTTTVTSGGDGSYPNILWGTVDVQYDGSHDSTGFITVRIRRASTSNDISIKGANFSGSSAQSTTLKLYGVDMGMPANQSYEFIATDIFNVTYGNFVLNLFYTVK